ncbi:MAG: hypothetical protein JWO03_929, partial [Bacteroidetes bacterium]|nr:hypothetical protein [Bacteroidota bacterium]
MADLTLELLAKQIQDLKGQLDKNSTEFQKQLAASNKSLIDLDSKYEVVKKDLVASGKRVNELENEHLKLSESHQTLTKAHDELETSHDDLSLKVDQIEVVPASAAPVVEKKPEFVPEKAKNLDKSGKPENEYHFTVKGNNYKFIAGHVTPPFAAGQEAPAKITALMAQEDTTLCAKLVDTGSG